MTTAARPRRSALYLPGSNPRALEKSRTLDADALILDLEDSVAPEAKDAGRQALATALADKAAHGGRELIVRVNGLDSPWGHEDLSAMACAGADAILLPKVESADMVRRAIAVLEAAGCPDDLAIWCMMETPRGILRAEEIANATRVGCLVLGTSDLTKDLRARHTPTRLPMLPALGMCILAARAAGIAVLDGVHLDLDDAEGFEAACLQGRELGFDGKTLIHPRQLEAANRVFGPGEAEIAHARRMIEAFDAARAQGKGVAVLDGKLVESLHVTEARRLIAIADLIARQRRQI